MIRPRVAQVRTGSPSKKIVAVKPPTIRKRLAAVSNHELSVSVADGDAQHGALIRLYQENAVGCDVPSPAALKMKNVSHYSYHAI